MRKAYQVWSVFDGLRRAKSWKKFQDERPEAWALKWEVERLRERLRRDAETDD